MEIRHQIMKLAYDMEQKLRENEHKGDWMIMSYEFLLGRLREEVEELEIFLDRSIKEYKEEAIKECADVANFAMMIADKLRRE